MAAPVILWLRRDLRLADQPALLAAMAAGPVIPVYVLDDETPRHRAMGGASRWWLHHSLAALAGDLAARGSRLILRRGPAAEVLARLAAEIGAGEVHALHHYEPWWLNAERALAKQLRLVLHHGNYLVPPGSVVSQAGEPYRIFTPFWRAAQQQLPPPPPRPAPASIPAPGHWPASDALGSWGLLPVAPDWAGGMRVEWTPGEGGAMARLAQFIPRARAYAERRNLPGVEATSRLSPHLAFGEISPATIWHAMGDSAPEGVQVFLSEIGWREYGQNIITQFPDYGARPYKPEFAHFPWREGPEAEADLRAWQQGRTGYPIVDAGMRQLWASGWMHNRVRMLVASLLTKHLLIDWRRGEEWFWDTLVDADYGQNVMNWQWNAGAGADANQFARIMAPLSQSARFSAAGYIRQWVPELAHLSDDEIHDPALPVRGYPRPIVGHAEGRARALAAYAMIRKG
ncbi:MAG: deoxyribodipyrimidine photo-lyase [Proteobacteria bacterium]|nr:deoxyribodipyrimidine photo-lyase [Pseudomonadota bacterium]